VDKIAEFQLRAAECRKEAVRASSGSVRDHYLKLAAMWTHLAQERMVHLRRTDPTPPKIP